MPDGAIQQLFPLSGFSRDEAYLEPGQTHLVTTICYVAAPPFGNEVLKLFATPAPIDFDPILTTRGPVRSSVQGAGPLEQWLAEIHAGTRSGRSRRARIGVKETEKGDFTATTPFFVIPSAALRAGSERSEGSV